MGVQVRCVPDGEDQILKDTLNAHKDDPELKTMLGEIEPVAQGVVDDTLAYFRQVGSNETIVATSIMGNCPSTVAGQAASSVENCFGGSVNTAGTTLGSSQYSNSKFNVFREI